MKIPEINAPFLTDQDIRLKSETFLQKYNSNHKIPVPIETIVEFDLNINIIPISGLQNILTVDGFITNDFNSSYVDNDMLEKIESRYLFTLAHELGHMFLHSSLYNSLSINAIEDYEYFLNNINSKQYGHFEYQAYLFAALILVPPIPLEESFQYSVSRLKKESFDLTKDGNIEIATRFIARSLQSKFKVSEATVLKRLKQDNLSL